MHDIDTTRLEIQDENPGNGYEVGSETESYSAAEQEDTLSELEELELATELLSVSSESELDHFLGGLLKKAWGGIRKVGATLGKAAAPFAATLKGLAKQALPAVGGALGSFIPIPGVGTALGTALGSAVGNSLEAELEGLSSEDREFEMARRFVRLAAKAAKSLAKTDPGKDPRAAIFTAIKKALGPQHAFAGSDAEYEGPMSDATSPDSGNGSRQRTGRWLRRGNRIILIGV